MKSSIRSNYISPIAATIFFAFLAGCNSTSVDTVEELGAGQVVQGIPYFLPKGLVHLVIKERVGVSAAADGTLVTKTKGPAKHTKTIRTRPKFRTAKTKQLVFSVAPVIVPDMDAGKFYARYRPNPFSSDHIYLSADGRGLLKTVETKVEDQTTEIIANVAQTLGNVAKAGARMGAFSAPLDRTTKKEDAKPVDIDLVVAPDELDLDAVNTILNLRGYSLRMNRTRPAGGGGNASGVSGAKGIVFKAPEAFEFVLSNSTPSDPEQTFRQSISVILPSDDEMFAFRQNRGFLITKQDKLVVQNGMLFGVTIDKPSEVLAASSIPLTITQEIVSSLEGIVSIKVSQAQSDTTLLQQQVAQTQAQIDLLEKQRALEAARANETTPPTTTP